MCHPEKGERKDWGRRKGRTTFRKGKDVFGEGEPGRLERECDLSRDVVGKPGWGTVGSAGNDSLRSQNAVGSGELLNILGPRIMYSTNKRLNE